MMASIKRGVVLSLNVGANRIYFGGLIDFLKRYSPDLVLLQEVSVETETLDSLVSRLGFQAICNVNLLEERYVGTAVVFKRGTNVEVTNLVLNRLQKVVWKGETFLNIYAPTGNVGKNLRREFFGDAVLKSLNRDNLPILAGDFNCIVDDEDTEKNAANKRCPMLALIVNAFGYTDGFRHLYPNKREFTFYRQTKSASRLDRVYIPNEILSSIISVEHVASMSDHKLVKIELHFKGVNENEGPKKKKGKSFWKLNTEILNETDFWTNFNVLWSKLIKAKGKYFDEAQWWERRAKPEIRKLCMVYSKDRANARRDTVTFLYMALDLALIDRDWNRVNLLKERLKGFHRENAMGVILRSKCNARAEEERASLYHANREMKNGQRNGLDKLKIGDKIEDDKQKIENEIMGFFYPLFNGMHEKGGRNTGVVFKQNEEYLREFLDPLIKLTDEQKEELEKEIKFDELEIIMKTLPKSKSPGLDGLPYEFYVKGFAIIGKELFAVFKCITRRFKLIESMMNGATRLAPKVTGVPKVNELRPITLLQCDYKIMTKLFVGRLLTVLPDLIKSGQLCSIQGKNILCGVSNLISTVQYVSAKGLKAAIVSLDQWKAYDRVFIDFLLQVMRAMGFGPIFLRWIKMLHTGNKTRFILSFLTNPIDVLFSVRQGDPIAMILYIIYLEPLLVQLKLRLRGMCLGNIRHILEAYVDDVNIVVTNEEDFGTIDEVFDKFEGMSGALLNRDSKSKIIGLGEWAEREKWPLNWLKVEKCIKVFGFFFRSNFEEMSKENWQTAVGKFRKVLFSWSSRMLDTLLQRVEILKIFATSKLWYISHVLELPKGVAKQFEKEIGNFVWRGCLERLAIDEIKNPLELGGLGLTCIESKAVALRMKHLCKLITRPNDDISYRLTKYWLGQSLGKYFPNLLPGPHFEVPTAFYKRLRDDFEQTIVGAFELDDLEVVGCITAKSIYKEIASTFPPPKIEGKLELDPTVEGASWLDVWRRLNHPVLESRARNVMFRQINNVLPTKQRLFRMGFRKGPFCDCGEIVVPLMGPLREGVNSRQGMIFPVGGPIETIEHLFCGCTKVAELWLWVKRRIKNLCPKKEGVSDLELINLIFPEGEKDETILWIISSYMDLVWENHGKGGELKLTNLRSQLKVLFDSHNAGRTLKLDDIDW